MSGLLRVLLIIFLVALAGCSTLESRTLPASQKNYDFPAYTVNPLAKAEWRFIGENRNLQSVSLIHADNQATMFFWIRPVLNREPDEETQDDIIAYFQDKHLKEFKLSPDIKLEEQKIETSGDQLNGRDYKVLKVNYDYEKNSYEVIIYYTVGKDGQILYSCSLWTKLTQKKEEGWYDKLKTDLRNTLEKVEYKTPEAKDMVILRVNYAFSDFSESAEDKYLSENRQKLEQRYQTAIAELEKWLDFKPNNFKAYNLLGVLATYNDKFEAYGENFDKDKARKYFKKAIEIKPYFKDAHINLAKLYKNTNQIENAIKEYEQASAISPNDENIYYEIGKIYEEKDDKVTAKKYYEKALRYWGSGFATRDELKKKIKNW